MRKMWWRAALSFVKKNWLWFVVGGSALIVLLILLIVLLLLFKRRNATLIALQSCLTGVKISKDTTSLVVPSNQCNDISLQTMDLSVFKKLRSVEVESRSFENIVNLKVEGLPLLEKIVVKDNCFSKQLGSLSVKGCSALSAISIGVGSFVSFSQLAIESSPVLSQLVLSGSNFNNADRVSLVGLNGLTTVEVGADSFLLKEGSFALTDCSSLTSLKIGAHSFAKFSSLTIENDDSLSSVEIGSLQDSASFTTAPLLLQGDCASVVEWIDLPSLSTVVIGKESFRDTDTVVVESVSSSPE